MLGSDQEKRRPEVGESEYEASMAELSAIALVGNTLAPLFLNDPGEGEGVERFRLLAALDSDELAASWPFVDNAPAKAAFRRMLGGPARGGAADVDDAYESLVWEYRRLFVGPAMKAAPPWGSVYTDQQCVVFGQTTLELRAWMALNGIRKMAKDNMPEDHIGLMLAMMAWIAERRPELLNEYLQLHLLTWAPHFLEGLASATRLPFYEGLADLTHDSLEGIRRARGIEVSYPHFFR